MLPTATFATDRPAPGTAVITPTGSFDVYSAPDARSLLLDAINEGRYRQVVDLSGVDFIDSTGLAVIVGAAKRARTHGGVLALVVDLDSRVGKALRITGLHKAIPHAGDVAGALVLLEPKTAPQAERPSFWPPHPGDVWLGNLGERIPLPLACGAGRRLYVGGDGMEAERAWGGYGPLRLVWRDGQVVTAMHASELAT